MNPFKGVCGRRGKRKPKTKKVEVEVKQEPGIKEEPIDEDNSVIDISQPRADETYRSNYEGSFHFDNDFDEIKDEIKSEEEETGNKKSSSPCERSDASAANDNDNEDLMGDTMEVQPSQPIDGESKRKRSSKTRNKRTIPRNQTAKKQKKHKCLVCNHLASNKSNLKRHLKIHTGEKPHQCEVCSKSFSEKSTLNRHQNTHGQLRCSKCGQGFEQEAVKFDHERSCDPRRFECDICGYRTLHKSNLRAHMRVHTGDKLFECPICFKSFTNNANLQIHSSTHKDELPNACTKCGRRFATPEDRQTHAMRCQRSLFACNQCRYKTVYKIDLNRHMQSKHGAKRSIECQLCAKQFVLQIKLDRHLSTAHNDQFPFQCSKCFGGYATENEKEVHEGSCGWRQYQCHLCKNYRQDIAQIKIHMRKHHTGERIQCAVCKASFIKKYSAVQHMKIVHRLKET